jgi:ElaB/YqjD/DUF883 family membrane-anchored ribosome-binding protein
VAQPQHGPMRTEVSDLRNIVDRLDLLMGSTADASASSQHALGESAREQIEKALADLAERVGALERETEELRTLVNHLMTIATWQAKVTATLVGDDEVEEPPEDHRPDADEDNVYAVAGPEHGFVDRVGRHVDPRRPEEPPMARHAGAATLDDDIDEILGTDREPSSEDSPPPDFGI